MVDVQGTVAAGFERVADAFAQNFEEFGELGAGFALVADGEVKVDIHAGMADKASGERWDENTLQLVFSTTKGAAAICVARLVDAGALSYDDRVADHWPEFAANGKGDITVAQVMSHQAGLPYVDRSLSLSEILAVDPIVEALAAQAPVWEPGSTHGYHALTYGWLAGELVRRVDGRSIGTYFRDEVAGPLGLDFWIGLPESEESRVSNLEAAPPPADAAALELMLKIMGPGTMGFKALTLNGSLMALGANENPFNTREVHATEMPAANGITNAVSLAKMYAATVSDVDGMRLVSPDVMRSASAEAVSGPDEALVAETRFGMGFMLNNELVPLIGPNAFGHAGAGGSLGQADPDTGVGYGYVMNQMLGGIAGDPRTVTLNNAVRSCL
jgi:CubicO group peptidase (beta-lactamase class C family)